MGLRTRAALLATVMLVTLVACSDKEPEPRSSAFVAPPLRFPAATASCPVTAPTAWTGPGVATRVLGDGPFYPIADYFRRDGATLELRPEDKLPDGTYGKKVRWISTGYVGPVLVRAGRLDGPGSAGAEFSGFGQRRGDGWYAELPQAEEYYDLPATTTVSGPGCFAYQIDGRGFSKTVVFRAVTAPTEQPATPS